MCVGGGRGGAAEWVGGGGCAPWAPRLGGGLTVIEALPHDRPWSVAVEATTSHPLRPLAFSCLASSSAPHTPTLGLGALPPPPAHTPTTPCSPPSLLASRQVQAGLRQEPHAAAAGRGGGGLPVFRGQAGKRAVSQPACFSCVHWCMRAAAVGGMQRPADSASPCPCPAPAPAPTAAPVAADGPDLCGLRCQGGDQVLPGVAGECCPCGGHGRS